MRRPRTNRRGIAAVALALTLGLSLTACSGGSGDDPSPSASASTSADAAADQAALSKVEVVWTDSTTKPTITLPSTPFAVTTPVIEIREPGTGETIEDGQLVTLSMAAVSGKDGSELDDTYSTKPESILVSSDFVFHDELVGQKVGTRFAFAFPEETEGAGSTVLAGEVVSTVDVATRASGETVTPPAGLPTVTLDADGVPTVTPVPTAAPTALVVQPLIKGGGEPITADQTVTVQYSLYLWDGTAIETSWDSEPTTFALNAVIPGWTEGLTGQTVGSQVLLIVPPDKGYGAAVQGNIPANSTLIFVVDILAAS